MSARRSGYQTGGGNLDGFLTVASGGCTDRLADMQPLSTVVGYIFMLSERKAKLIPERARRGFEIAMGEMLGPQPKLSAITAPWVVAYHKPIAEPNDDEVGYIPLDHEPTEDELAHYAFTFGGVGGQSMWVVRRPAG